MPEFEAFVASADISDSIKLESSVLSPDHEKRVKSLTRLVSRAFISKYEQFIPMETIREQSDVENGVIVVSEEAMTPLYREWTGKDPRDEVSGFFDPRSHQIILVEPNSYWTQVSESIRQSALAMTGGETRARRVIGWTGLKSTLAHELVHSMGSRTLPEWFQECGAMYYQRYIEEQLAFGYFTNPMTEKAVALYNQLLLQFGNDVHRTFFGSETEQVHQIQVFSSIPKYMIQELFPQS
jgi:hypothetical protein